MERHACRKRLVRREETDTGIGSVDGETGNKQSLRGEKTDTGIGWEDGETCIEETIIVRGEETDTGKGLEK
jgi:hypothetical protein